ncbi:EpsG family protein [Photobacterium aquimaris]|uniref:EpsG family protein n=1 Tax=Photobacterium aquimaris TaxID=512643 RepID=A0A2T3IH20_9GAMM|nr:EpsG family protein [Photobacterium aquimaris]OBU23532.1 hypothetical protein AYY20_01555 [Photobacterium aquimaris]PSU26642.1 EpsG family protein [Photobacterium aquimaris]
MYSILIISLFIVLFLSCYNGKLNTLFFVVISTFVFFIISLRGIDVDRDSATYFSVFNQIKEVGFEQLIAASSSVGQEIGFVFFMKITSFIGLDFYEFRFLFNLVCLFSVFFIIFEYVPSRFRVIVYLTYVSMFVLFRDFTQIRFTLACLLSLISILMALENKYNKSITLFLLSIVFHNSTLIILPILVVLKYIGIDRLFRFYWIIAILGCSFLCQLFNPIHILSSLNFLPHQITRYIGSAYLDGGNTIGLNFYISFFLVVLLAINYKSYYGIDYKILYICMLFSASTALLFYGMPILMRMQLLCFTGFIFTPLVIYKYFIKDTLFNNYFFQIFFSILFVSYFYKILGSGIVCNYYFYN